mgnify:CR=1 FL=1
MDHAPARGRRPRGYSDAVGSVLLLFLCVPLQLEQPFPLPLPKISDLLRKLSGFKYATAIDLSMGYYHIPLDLEAQKMCTTILPWGKYQYKRLYIGVKTSSDIATLV